MTKPLPAIALALKDARKRAGLSQQELARVSGVARITISGIEIGKHPSIRTTTAEKLAKSLGMSPGELLRLGQSPATELQIGKVDSLLEAYHALKRGTVMVPSPAEDRWLRQQLAQWADEKSPTPTSVLFLLLAHRHAD